jgi:hypothetical protein
LRGSNLIHHMGGVMGLGLAPTAQPRPIMMVMSSSTCNERRTTCVVQLATELCGRER